MPQKTRAIMVLLESLTGTEIWPKVSKTRAESVIFKICKNGPILVKSISNISSKKIQKTRTKMTLSWKFNQKLFFDVQDFWPKTQKTRA